MISSTFGKKLNLKLAALNSVTFLQSRQALIQNPNIFYHFIMLKAQHCFFRLSVPQWNYFSFFAILIESINRNIITIEISDTIAKKKRNRDMSQQKYLIQFLFVFDDLIFEDEDIEEHCSMEIFGISILK